MNLGIFLFFLSIWSFYLRSITSLFVPKLPFILWSAFCPSSDHSCPKQHKSRHKKQQNRDKKQNVLCVLTFLLRDCAEEKFIVAFVKYNPWLFVHTLLESQRKGLFLSSTLQNKKNCSCYFPNELMILLYRTHVITVIMPTLKVSTNFCLLCQCNGPKMPKISISRLNGRQTQYWIFFFQKSKYMQHNMVQLTSQI